MKIAKLLSKIFLFCILYACNSNHQPTVTVYVSADEYIAREIFKAFTEKTGINVRWLGDTEATKTTALVERLIQEKDNPIADVFWSSEILGTIKLKSNHLLASVNTEVTNSWPDIFKDNDGYWFAFSARARVIAFNPEIIQREQLPQTWWEYTDAAFADPRFGTTGTHFVAMSLLQEDFNTFIHSVKKPLLGGNAATVQAVLNGQSDFAMTDSDDVFAAQAQGHNIEMFFPRHHGDVGGGTLFIPNTISLIEGGKHKEEAIRFLEFMLSDYVAQLLAESPSRNYPIQQHLQNKYPKLRIHDPFEVDFEMLALQKDTVVKYCMEVFGQQN